MVKIVGILNITPDSFSDGGKYNSPELAIKQVQKMIKDGVDIIDVGAESTRPTAIPIDVETELSRLKPILQDVALLVHSNNVQISIDTYKPEVAEFAVSSGVDFINDVTGFTNVNMVKVAASSNKKIIVTHNLRVLAHKTEFASHNMGHIDEVLHWAQLTISNLEEHGIKHNNIIIDPGIGFGKTKEQSWNIIHNIEKLHELEVEIYVGHSRKRFLNLDDNDKADNSNREAYALAISTMLVFKKIHYIRVHNVPLHTTFFAKMF